MQKQPEVWKQKCPLRASIALTDGRVDVPVAGPTWQDKVWVLHEKRRPLPQDEGNISVWAVHTKQAASVQSDAQKIKTSATLGVFILNKSSLKNKILQTLTRRALFQVKYMIFLLQSTHLKDIPAVKKHFWPLPTRPGWNAPSSLIRAAYSCN